MSPLLSVLSTAGDSTGLPSLVGYGVAAPLIAFMYGVIRWQQGQMKAKDDALAKLNDRLIVQGDRGIEQAERLAPLISDASAMLRRAMEQRSPYPYSPEDRPR